MKKNIITTKKLTGELLEKYKARYPKGYGTGKQKIKCPLWENAFDRYTNNFTPDRLRELAHALEHSGATHGSLNINDESYDSYSDISVTAEAYYEETDAEYLERLQGLYEHDCKVKSQRQKESRLRNQEAKKNKLKLYLELKKQFEPTFAKKKKSKILVECE